MRIIRRGPMLASLRSRVYLSLFIGFVFLATLFSLYYFSFRRMATQQIRQSFDIVTSEIEDQVTANLSLIDQAAKVSGYSVAVQRALLSIIPNERIQNMNVAIDVIANAKAFNDSILDIVVYVDDHNRLYSNTTYEALFKTAIDAYALETGPFVEDPFYTDIVYLPNGDPAFLYYIPVRNALPVAENRQNAAFCLVLVNIQHMISLPQSDSIVAGSLAIVTGDQVIIAPDPFDAQMREALLHVQDGISQLTLGDETHLAYSFRNEATRWRFVYTVRENTLLGDLFAARNQFFVFLLVGTCVVLASILINLVSISTSIRQVARRVESLGDAAGDAPIEPPNIEELAILTNRINALVVRLDALYAAREQSQRAAYSAVIAQQKAEMAVHRSQISPHFLFNTLECIRAMAHHYQAGPVEELTSATARLLEYSLYTESIVPLEQELAHVQDYVRVMSIRVANRYECRVDAPPETLTHPVLSMTLQPLAENAILHGARGLQMRRPFILHLRARIDGEGVLCIRVTDNGCGIPADRLRILNAHTSGDGAAQAKKSSIGIGNIYARLKLMDARCDLVLYSKEGYYTVAELRVPPGLAFPASPQALRREHAGGGSPPASGPSPS